MCVAYLSTFRILDRSSSPVRLVEPYTLRTTLLMSLFDGPVRLGREVSHIISYTTGFQAISNHHDCFERRTDCWPIARCLRILLDVMTIGPVILRDGKTKNPKE